MDIRGTMDLLWVHKCISTEKDSGAVAHLMVTRRKERTHNLKSQRQASLSARGMQLMREEVTHFSANG